MKEAKRKKLECAGFRVGSVQEFLELSEEKMSLIDLKVRLIGMLKEARKSAGITQEQLAKRISSSQSRVAKMEAGDPTVSLDLLVQGMLAAGATRREIADALAPTKKVASA